MSSFQYLFLVFSAIFVSLSSSQLESRYASYPQGIEWRTYEEALVEAAANNKYIFVLFTSTSCGACSKLKKDLKSDPREFVELARELIMVNIEGGDDKSKIDKRLFQDGEYVPRTYFLNPSGELEDRLELQCSNKKYPYFCMKQDLVEKMHIVVDLQRKYQTTKLAEEAFKNAEKTVDL